MGVHVRDTCACNIMHCPRYWRASQWGVTSKRGMRVQWDSYLGEVLMIIFILCLRQIILNISTTCHELISNFDMQREKSQTNKT